MEKELVGMQQEVVRKAQQIAEEFMAARSTDRRMDRQWSDLVLRVRNTERRGFAVEWRERYWIPQAKQKGRRYIPRHVAARDVVRHAKPEEREEVAAVRNKLTVLQWAYKELDRIRRELKKQQVLGDEADTSVGFVPRAKDRRRSADGRFIPDDR